MIDKIIRFIEKNNMFENCTKIVAGLSGGADSVCLMEILCELKARYGYELQAIHVHHGIRGEEADRDVQFCLDLCGKYGISCQIVYYDVLKYAEENSLSVEEAGRILRYEAFTAACDRTTKIAVAHHMNDRAETVLFNICRGTGLKGLCGIKPVRDNVIRPLLCCTRVEIENYLLQKGQKFCMDSTNDTNDYTRNMLRNMVIPVITDKINSKAVENIAALANRAQEAEEYLEKLTLQKYRDKVAYMNGAVLLRRLGKEEEFMIRRLIINAIREMKCGLKDVSSIHIDNVVQLIKLQSGSRCDICEGLIAEKTKEGILFYYKDDMETLSPVDVEVPCEIKPWENMEKFTFNLIEWDTSKKILNEVYTKCFDYDKIKIGLQLRGRIPGDVIAIDTQNHHKKIKQYFVDKGMSRREKQSTVLLADGNHIMWIVGDRIGEDYKISDSTKRVLVVKYGG